MTERTALILLFAVMSVVSFAVFVILQLLGASDQVVAFSPIPLACIWSERAATIVMRYGRKRRAAERRHD